jgi:ribosomal protein L7/L12
MELALALVVVAIPIVVLVALALRGGRKDAPRERDTVAPREGHGHAHLEPIHAGSAAPGVPVSTLPTGPLDAAQDAEVRRYVASGEKIMAIKRWRELTGLGLAESKAAVDALFGQGLPPPLSSVPQGHGFLPAQGPKGATPELVLEARQLVANGKKIEAIKRWREATGMGLKEAKDAVEAL